MTLKESTMKKRFKFLSFFSLHLLSLFVICRVRSICILTLSYFRVFKKLSTKIPFSYRIVP